MEWVGFLTSAGRLEITQGTTTYGVDKTAAGSSARAALPSCATSCALASRCD
ncbi:hypothetical protein [Corallococcus interemptor]|uniref:hypothetical protein n=1 Tax=Corallococcus interemptor TaxID=2316720 RepID=UPI0013153BA2|nr:hypothetical protein [Corallococcus interemptor]